MRADQQATTTFLLGRVLHELGNPAAALHNNAAWLVDAFDAFAAGLAAGTADVEAALRDLRSAVHDIAAASRELNERIARFRRGEPASVVRDGGARLGAAVRSALSVVGADLRKRARLALELVEDPQVVMDAVPLSQVVVNLLTNAWEAIEGPSDDNRVVVRTYVSGRRALLEVEDTGRGVPDELAPFIFDPFRSDKTGDEPRGLGLAIVRDVVTAAGGAIHYRRPPSGRGALFVVELPLVVGA